jgi:hypothetical protein
VGDKKKTFRKMKTVGWPCQCSTHHLYSTHKTSLLNNVTEKLSLNKLKVVSIFPEGWHKFVSSQDKKHGAQV